MEMRKLTRSGWSQGRGDNQQGEVALTQNLTQRLIKPCIKEVVLIV